MITKETLDNKEHIFVYFGKGTVIVSEGYPEDTTKGKATDLILSESNESHPIGCVSQEIEEASCTTELTNPIILRFDNVASIDVVMKVLCQIRDNLAAIKKAKA